MMKRMLGFVIVIMTCIAPARVSETIPAACCSLQLVLVHPLPSHLRKAETGPTESNRLRKKCDRGPSGTSDSSGETSFIILSRLQASRCHDDKRTREPTLPNHVSSADTERCETSKRVRSAGGGQWLPHISRTQQPRLSTAGPKHCKRISNVDDR